MSHWFVQKRSYINQDTASINKIDRKALKNVQGTFQHTNHLSRFFFDVWELDLLRIGLLIVPEPALSRH